jgi:hypothetical protein
MVNGRHFNLNGPFEAKVVAIPRSFRSISGGFPEFSIQLTSMNRPLDVRKVSRISTGPRILLAFMLHRTRDSIFP